MRADRTGSPPARRRTRHVAVLALAAVSLLGGAACITGERPSFEEDDAPGAQANPRPRGASDVETVADGRLTVCVDVANPPFGFEKEGGVDGIDAELVRALAGRLGLEAVFVPVAREEAPAALDAAKCDLSSAVVATDDRAAGYLLSAPYFLVRSSLLVRAADATAYPDLGSLRGRKVGVQGGTAGAAYAASHGEGLTTEAFGDVGRAGELFAALEQGRIDGVVHDLPTNAYQAVTTGRTAVAATFADDDARLYSLAMATNRGDMQKVVDDALRQVKADDTYPTVLRRFVGEFAAQALQDVTGP